MPKKEKIDDVITIFTYGRPDHPRNGFEISMNVFKKLKEKYGNKIQIISAGAEWNPKDVAEPKQTRETRIGSEYHECRAVQ